MTQTSFHINVRLVKCCYFFTFLFFIPVDIFEYIVCQSLLLAKTNPDVRSK